MRSTKLVTKFSRFWRCYLLLLFASFLSFILIYLSQKDPKLESYFPIFGSKYLDIYGDGGLKKIKDLMQPNHLDYEFIHPNSRFCIPNDKWGEGDEFQVEMDDMDDQLPNVDASDKSTNEQQSSSLDYLFLVISQVANYRHRNAIRSTWSKHLGKVNSKHIFMVGNPTLDGTESKKLFARNSRVDNGADATVIKLDKEINDFKDIVQINMPDHENFTSTKQLLAIRWALTYCSTAKSLFILSDSAVLNYKSFEKLIKSRNLSDLATGNNLIGSCALKDEKLPLVLKVFFTEVNKDRKKQQQQQLSQSVERSSSLNKSNSFDRPRSYGGQYCSDLGWVVGLNAAKRLWQTGLSSPYMMKLSPGYLNGYLAFKARLTHVDAFKYFDYVPVKNNCLETLDAHQDNLLCVENFTISSRYTNYIATWNLGQLFILKL